MLPSMLKSISFAAMKKVLLYLLLSVMMLGNTTVSQLSRIHYLFEHFTEHHRLNKDLSLVAFLEMHYWGKDLPDNDDEQDNQLPFKHPVNHFHFDFYHPAAVVAINIAAEYTLPVYGLPKPYDLPEGNIHALLRPPRLHDMI